MRQTAPPAPYLVARDEDSRPGRYVTTYYNGAGCWTADQTRAARIHGTADEIRAAFPYLVTLIPADPQE